jgi:hypothetical protein
MPFEEVWQTLRIIEYGPSFQMRASFSSDFLQAKDITLTAGVLKLQFIGHRPLTPPKYGSTMLAVGKGVGTRSMRL